MAPFLIPPLLPFLCGIASTIPGAFSRRVAGAALSRPTWPILLSCVLSEGSLPILAQAEERDLSQRLPGYVE